MSKYDERGNILKTDYDNDVNNQMFLIFTIFTIQSSLLHLILFNDGEIYDAGFSVCKCSGYLSVINNLVSPHL